MNPAGRTDRGIEHGFRLPVPAGAPRRRTACPARHQLQQVPGQCGDRRLVEEDRRLERAFQGQGSGHELRQFERHQRIEAEREQLLVRLGESASAGQAQQAGDLRLQERGDQSFALGRGRGVESLAEPGGRAMRSGGAARPAPATRGAARGADGSAARTARDTGPRARITAALARTCGGVMLPGSVEARPVQQPAPLFEIQHRVVVAHRDRRNATSPPASRKSGRANAAA